MPAALARRRSPWRLGAVATAAAVGAALCVVPTPAQAAAAPAPRGPASLAAQVADLNAQIDRVGDELAEGATAYEAAAAELVRLTQLEFAASADHEVLSDAAAESRQALGGLARSAYKGGLTPTLTALMSGDPGAVADLAYVRRSVDRLSRSRSDLARDLDVQSVDAGRALEQSGVLRQQALVQRQAIAIQLVELTDRTDLLTGELTAAAERLAQARAEQEERIRLAEQAKEMRQARDAEERRAVAARAAAANAAATGTATASGQVVFTGAGCQPASPIGEANGFLSPAGLCALDTGRGHRLRSDAAAAFNSLNRARLAATGAPLCVTDSYRSYPAQVDVFRRKPGLAATPGRSQHGWGLAVDLCGGVQTFGSEAHRWMQVNAPLHGWVHPAWARPGGSRPEAWHWEYGAR